MIETNIGMGSERAGKRDCKCVYVCVCKMGGGCMVVCMDRFELMDHSVIWLWCTATLEAKTKTHGKSIFSSQSWNLHCVPFPHFVGLSNFSYLNIFSRLFVLASPGFVAIPEVLKKVLKRGNPGIFFIISFLFKHLLKN